MSVNQDHLPFKIGQTLCNGTTTVGLVPSATSIDTTNAQYIQGVKDCAGKIYEIDDVQWDSTAAGKPNRTSTRRKIMAVINDSGAFLAPKRLVALKLTTAGGDAVTKVSGYSTDPHQGGCFPVDEFLPSTGVAPNDVFYVVVEGVAMCTTSTEADATNLIAAGDILGAMTGTTAAGTASGRVFPFAAAASTNGGTALLNRIGRAMSAKTTSQVAGDCLVMVLPH